jgi:putative ABC transport system permease protein
VSLFERGRSEERELARELEQHVGERVEALVAEGMPLPEAERTARRELGNVTLIQERARDVWRHRLLEESWADVRHALRQLRRAPSFATATILTLALGIGANTAVFSLVNAVLLRSLPFPEPERLVAVRSVDTRSGHLTGLSYPTFFDFRRDNRVFEHIVCYRDDTVTLTGRGEPVQLRAQIVSWDLFPMLRVQPALGRGFLPSEEAPGQRVVVLGHSLWVSRFGGDPEVVGTAVTIDGQPHTVVGVAPAGFNFPIRGRPVQVWTTLGRDASSTAGQPATRQRGARMLEATARLRRGVSLQAAQAGLDTVAAALAAVFPDENGNIARTRVQPELERLVGPARAPLLVLFGAVAVVLLVAAVNVAAMLLARTTDRERELGIRMAIGGSRARVVRQLLTENACLAVLGSVAGLGVAGLALSLAMPIAAGRIPRFAEARLDGRVLAFCVVAAFLAALLVSIPAAARVARMDADGTLRGRTGSGGNGRDRLRSALIVVQIAAGIVLSASASLLVADFARLVDKDLGFRPDHLLTFAVSLPDSRYPVEAQVEFVGRLVERLRGVPGVTSASAAMPLPVVGDMINVAFDIEERRAPPPERPRSDMAIVTPGYFRTIGTRIIDGRVFDEHDDGQAPPVLVVNEAFAQRFFPGERAVGKRIEPGASSGRGTMLREIVGVVGNARQSVFGPRPEPVYYFPYAQMPWGPPPLVLRTSVPPLLLEPTVREVVRELDKEVPLFDVETMSGILAAQVAAPRFTVLLMGSFAAMALLLSAVGLYGILTYAVVRRTREIGVRIALGGTRRHVMGMVLQRAMAMVALGLPVGIAGALAASRLLGRLACGIVTLTAAAAALLPARRAASVDPARALRTE